MPPKYMPTVVYHLSASNSCTPYLLHGHGKLYETPRSPRTKHQPNHWRQTSRAPRTGRYSTPQPVGARTYPYVRAHAEAEGVRVAGVPEARQVLGARAQQALGHRGLLRRHPGPRVLQLVQHPAGRARAAIHKQTHAHVRVTHRAESRDPLSYATPPHALGDSLSVRQMKGE